MHEQKLVSQSGNKDVFCGRKVDLDFIKLYTT